MKYPPERKAETRERIVEAAAGAIRRCGPSGIGIAELMREVGLTHGGFYAHFESREALIAEAGARAGQHSLQRMLRGMQHAAPGTSPLRAMAETYLSDAHRRAPERGCLLAAVGSELSRGEPALRAVAAAQIAGLGEQIRCLLPQPDAPEAQAEALAILSTMVGALTLARLSDDEVQAAAILRAACDRIAPPPAT